MLVLHISVHKSSVGGIQPNQRKGVDILQRNLRNNAEEMRKTAGKDEQVPRCVTERETSYQRQRQSLLTTDRYRMEGAEEGASDLLDTNNNIAKTSDKSYADITRTSASNSASQAHSSATGTHSSARVNSLLRKDLDKVQSDYKNGESSKASVYIPPHRRFSSMRHAMQRDIAMESLGIIKRESKRRETETENSAAMASDDSSEASFSVVSQDHERGEEISVDSVKKDGGKLLGRDSEKMEENDLYCPPHFHPSAMWDSYGPIEYPAYYHPPHIYPYHYGMYPMWPDPMMYCRYPTMHHPMWEPDCPIAGYDGRRYEDEKTDHVTEECQRLSSKDLPENEIPRTPSKDPPEERADDATGSEFSTPNSLPPRLRLLQRLADTDSDSMCSSHIDWKSHFREKCLGYGVNYIDSHCHIDLLFNRHGYKGTWEEYRQENSDTFPANYDGCVAVFCNPASFRSEGKCFV